MCSASCRSTATPVFEIRPADYSIFSARFHAPNAAMVFQKVERLERKEADVLRNGA
jgi:hypothetical protein